MSRVLKFIVHLVVFLVVVCILALAVPPLAGISTVVVEDADWETNLPLGSVTYGKELPAESILVGDSIVVQDSSQVYRYRVKEIELDNSVFTVFDPGDLEAGAKVLTLGKNVTRAYITINWLGYLLIAIQSVEGLIIIGLVVLFLIIMFILAELWRKDLESPEDEEDAVGAAADEKVQIAAERGKLDSQGSLGAQKGREIQKSQGDQKSMRQLKKEARERQKAEVARLKAEAKERRKEEKIKLKQAKKIARTGGFIEDMEPVEALLGMEDNSLAEQAADEAHEELKKEIGAASQKEKIQRLLTAEIPGIGKRGGEPVPRKEKVKAQEEPKRAQKGQGKEQKEKEKVQEKQKLEKMQESPEKMQKSPEKVKKSPEKVQKSPEKVQKKTEKILEKPEKMQKKTEKVLENPGKVQKKPGKMQKSPEKVQENQGKVQEKPRKMQEKPEKVQENQGKVRENPEKAQEKTQKAQEEPKKAQEKPKKAQEEPEKMHRGQKELQEKPEKAQKGAQGAQSPAKQDLQPEKQEEKKEAVKLAIPRYTLDELLEKAESAGEEPDFVEDDETGVCFLDYSSIIGEQQE